VCIGTRGRTAPQRLDRRLEEEEDDADLFGLSRTASVASDSDTDHFVINTEPVGEILAVSIAVRHRHLTDEWYLRYVLLSDPERTRTRHFPCHNVVLSKATLRPGEGISTSFCSLGPVHTSNIVEATFDFVATNGNNVERFYCKISSFRQCPFDIVASVDEALDIIKSGGTVVLLWSTLV